MRQVGSVESGETPTTDEQTDGLAIGNRMLDAWTAERLLCFSVQRTTHTLVASTNPQTIGSGGNIDTDRPVKIEQAGLIVAGEDNEYPIRVFFSVGEYARIVNKETETGIPLALYYDAAFPLGKIYLYPVPDAANTLVLYRWTPLTSIATVGTTVTYPPGYEEAFVSNLAVRLAADGLGQLTEAVAIIARESLARIKSVNMQVPVMRNDAAGIDGNQYCRSHIN